jgi:hypothetical protein
MYFYFLLHFTDPWDSILCIDHWKTFDLYLESLKQLFDSLHKSVLKSSLNPYLSHWLASSGQGPLLASTLEQVNWPLFCLSVPTHEMGLKTMIFTLQCCWLREELGKYSQQSLACRKTCGYHFIDQCTVSFLPSLDPMSFCTVCFSVSLQDEQEASWRGCFPSSEK